MQALKVQKQQRRTKSDDKKEKSDESPERAKSIASGKDENKNKCN